MAAGAKMPWALSVAQEILDMPTMVRVEVERQLEERVIDVFPEQDRDLTDEEEALIDVAAARFMRDTRAARLERLAQEAKEAWFEAAARNRITPRLHDALGEIVGFLRNTPDARA